MSRAWRPRRSSAAWRVLPGCSPTSWTVDSYRRTRGPGRAAAAGTQGTARILAPGEVTALLDALRTRRDRALVLVMVLGGLLRVEALGLALGDLQPGDRRVRVTQAKGGRERIVPVDDAFFSALHDYLDSERPGGAPTDRVFVVLKRPTGGGHCPRPARTTSSSAHATAQARSTPRAASCAAHASRR